MLEIKGISKAYGKKQVLEQMDLKLDDGKIIGLLGPNGSGKSTLIKCINGLLSLDEGEILFDGQAPGPSSKSAISYLPERPVLDPVWKVKDAIAFYESFYPDFDTEKAKKLIADFGLDENQRLKHMSKGMQEKVQLSLVMSRKAKLYILDEPMSGIDPAARSKILETILSNFDDDASLLISTHLITDVETILDEAVFIKDGKVLLHQNVESLRQEKKKSVDQLFREIYA